MDVVTVYSQPGMTNCTAYLLPDPGLCLKLMFHLCSAEFGEGPVFQALSSHEDQLLLLRAVV